MSAGKSALCLVLGAVALATASVALNTATAPDAVPLPTGKTITPHGEHIGVGSFPTTLALSPDGRYLVASSLGRRTQLSVLDSATGSLVSSLKISGNSPVASGKTAGLYVGLAFSSDGRTLYAARGSDHRVGAFSLSPDGTLADTGRHLPADFAAGIATDGRRIFASANTGEPKDRLRGFLTIANLDGTDSRKVALPGYPLGVVWARDRVYVASEQDGAVWAVDPDGGAAPTRIRTGTQPGYLIADHQGSRVYVANAGSDTVSVVDTRRRRVVRTILLRPAAVRSLPSANPLGLALSPDGSTLFVALADLNAVALVDTKKGSVEGYLPTGWYPTSVAVSGDGARLFVACAKGTAERNPNGAPKRYIQDLFEGTVATLNVAEVRKDLTRHTQQVLENNRIGPDVLSAARRALQNPGIEHVVYVIKENRTYDQVLGDLGRGDGDPTLTLFGREVTPNQHALAERFVLLDNFYCAAEVSGDGWNYSTSGVASAYATRNVAYGYTGKARPYDYEGTNNGVAPDRRGIMDVAAGPGGYLWDKAIAKRVSLRNYGMFTDDIQLPRRTAEEGSEGPRNSPTKRALASVTCEAFRQYDLTFADSEAWVKHGLKPAPKQMASYGDERDPSRITTWRREYEGFVRTGKMPRLMLVRLGRDHTAGTAAGQYSPRAMVADNDYALGQLVETISRGPLWKKTAIFVVEDDAQNGYDHVDAHRSIAFVISPFVRRGSHDSRFFNTDSVLHTIECLLGLDPMTLNDAAAPVLSVFGASADNDAPFAALLPDRAIVGDLNRATAYRAQDSARLINPLQEESAPDEELNEILWRSHHGARAPLPAKRYGLRLGFVARDRDDDDAPGRTKAP